MEDNIRSDEELQDYCFHRCPHNRNSCVTAVIALTIGVLLTLVAFGLFTAQF